MRMVPEGVPVVLEQVAGGLPHRPQEPAPFLPPRHATLGFEDVRRGPVDLTRELRGGRAPEHDHVVGRACLDQGRLQAAGEHEHPGEHEYDERYAADRERRGEATCPEAPPDIRERDPHQAAYPTVRRPTTIGIRMTRFAGMAAAASPARRAAPIPSAMVRGATLITGKKVGSAFANPFTIGNVSSSPSTPPRARSRALRRARSPRGGVPRSRAS